MPGSGRSSNLVDGPRQPCRVHSAVLQQSVFEAVDGREAGPLQEEEIHQVSQLGATEHRNELVGTLVAQRLDRDIPHQRGRRLEPRRRVVRDVDPKRGDRQRCFEPDEVWRCPHVGHGRPAARGGVGYGVHDGLQRLLPVGEQIEVIGTTVAQEQG